MNKKGFTLTELLMVVVILGILGGIALPKFFPQKEKAYITEAIGMLSAIRQSLEAYRTEYGAYCSAGGGTGTACVSGWTTLGLDDPNSDTIFANRAWDYKVDTASSDSTYTVTAARKNNNGADTNANKTVILARNGTYTGDHPNRPA